VAVLRVTQFGMYLFKAGLQFYIQYMVAVLRETQVASAVPY